MGILTTAEAVNAIPTVVAAEFLEALANKVIIAKLARRDFEKDVRQFGDTVNVSIPPTDYVTNLIVDGDPVTPQVRALGNAQVILNRHREITFQITDISRALALPDIGMEHMQQAAAKMGDDVDNDILSIFSSFSTTAVGTFGVGLLEATLVAARTALVNNQVPVTKPLFGVFSPNSYQDLSQISRFTEVRMLGTKAEGAIGEGLLGGYEPPKGEGYKHGRVQSINVFEDQGVNTTTGVPVEEHNIVFSPDGILLVFRPIPNPIPGTGAMGATIQLQGYAIRVVTTYNGANLGQQWTADVLYGFSVGRDNFGVEVKR